MAIGIFILFFVLCAIANAASDSNKLEEQEAAQKRLERVQSIEAKQPEHLAKLLAEEYPDFSGSFTYARASDALGRSDSFFSERRLVLKHPNKPWKIDGRTYTDFEEKKQAAAVFFAENLADAFSSEFGDYARSNPGEFYDTWLRTLAASETLANG